MSLISDSDEVLRGVIGRAFQCHTGKILYFRAVLRICCGVIPSRQFDQSRTVKDIAVVPVEID